MWLGKLTDSAYDLNSVDWSIKLHLNQTIHHLFYRVETVNGTACAGEDYKPIKEKIKFDKNERVQSVFIEIVDDFEWEPDEFFFVKMSIPQQEDGSHERVAIGATSLTEVTIINDDGRLYIVLVHCNISFNPCHAE